MSENLFNTEDKYRWQQLHAYLISQQFDKGFIESINQLAVASSYALTQLSKQTEWLAELSALESLDLSDSTEIISNEAAVDLIIVKKKLRQYRHLKLVQIIYLDVVKNTELRETLRQLSLLADLLIRQALSACEKQLAEKHGQPIGANGEPMQLNIIAMGKRGGRELNFSSDIDLICCYAGDGELKGFGHLSYQEFFTRVVRLLSKCLNENTEDGFVYRVDLRLRPWGDSGPVALSHAGLEHYYQLHGREWEQYAMVKARIISGSQADKSYLASILKPFVYRKYHDYRVFEGLASLKDKIDHQAKSRGMHENIKLGPGGIREIEFFVQAFQILKGGRNNLLQSTEIYNCFDVLEQQAVISIETVQDLREAYGYLRLLENRIQMLNDQQTHNLPVDEVSQQRIACSLSTDNWQMVEQQQQVYRNRVSEHFNELFKRNNQDEAQSQKQADIVIDASIADDANQAAQREFVHSLGIDSADNIVQKLNAFFQDKAWHFMSAKAKQRFTALLPKLLRTLADSKQPIVLFERLLRLFSSIAGRSVYFELLHQSEALLVKLCDLFDKSEWISDEVARYPMLLEHLIHGGNLENRFDCNVLESNLRQQLDNVIDDPELELDVLRLFKREQTIVIATAELAQEISAVEVCHYLAELAEILLMAVYQLARKAIESQYGLPQYEESGTIRNADFAIIGYGKLGGREMHYQSDLDVIFLHNSTGTSQQSSGPKVIDNSFYFARLAQKIISMTSVLTGSGKLYEIDSRLRPEGSSGLLVTSTLSYQKYQLEKAWTWEHQALIRARLVVGPISMMEQFQHIRSEALRQPRNADKLTTEIIEMRDKMYQAKQPVEGEFKNLKHSRGCMIDIEFMVQYWVLLHANKIGSICSYSDNISLLNELIRLNVIPGSQSQLIDIYLTYHRCLHEAVLQNKPAEIEYNLIEAEVTQVLESWKECFCL